MSKSYIIAIIIAGIIGGWLISGQLRDQTEATKPAVSIAEQNEEIKLQRVRTRISKAMPHTADVVLRGRTEALRKVHVKAETMGRIIALPPDKGQQVEQGDLLCQLDPQDRTARLAEAKAQVRARKLELDQAKTLKAKGHRSQTAVASAQANYDSAAAGLRAIQVDLNNTYIRAPFDGVIEDLPNKFGSYLRNGDLCAVLVDEDPFLVTAQLSEREVSVLSEGDSASIQLVDGSIHKGKVRFLAKSADQVTRTFLTEIQIPNPDRNLREGMTANITVAASEQLAHQVTSDILTLSDAGQIGLKVVEPDQTVTFVPVTIIDQRSDGIFVTGLPDETRIITVGQEFVLAGEKVAIDNVTEPDSRAADAQIEGSGT